MYGGKHIEPERGPLHFLSPRRDQVRLAVAGLL